MLARGISLSGESPLYFAERRMEKLAALLRSARPAGRVLDFGCGTGRTVPLLMKAMDARQGVGVDVSPKSVEIARARHAAVGAMFFLITEFDEPESFDVAYCNGVFHHVPPHERPEALAYVWRQLKSGGFFAFWENNPWNPGTQFAMWRTPFDRDAVKIRLPEAKRLLRDAGFQVEHSESMFLFPRMLSRLRVIEPYLLRVPIGAQYLVLARKPL